MPDICKQRNCFNIFCVISANTDYELVTPVVCVNTLRVFIADPCIEKLKEFEDIKYNTRLMIFRTGSAYYPCLKSERVRA